MLDAVDPTNVDAKGTPFIVCNPFTVSLSVANPYCIPPLRLDLALDRFPFTSPYCLICDAIDQRVARSGPNGLCDRPEGNDPLDHFLP